MTSNLTPEPVVVDDAANPSAALRQQGLQQLKAGSFAGAIELLSRARALNPAVAQTQLDLGIALQGAGRHAEALEYFGQQRQSLPNAAAPFLHAAMSLLALSKADVYDVVEGVVRLLDRIPEPSQKPFDESDPTASTAPWKICNIGNDRSVEISRAVDLLEAELGLSAIREFAPMQPGDVAETRADISELEQAVGFRPSTSLEEGIKSFVAWYRGYDGSSGGRTNVWDEDHVRQR